MSPNHYPLNNSELDNPRENFEPDQPILANILIPTPRGNVDVSLTVKPTFVMGRNGTGKSALVHYIRGLLQNKFKTRLIYLPGSRPSYFDGDSLNMTANARLQFEQNSVSWDASPDIRIRPVSGTSRNERAIFDLQAAEIQYDVDAANDIKVNGRKAKSIARLQSNSSPIDRVNTLLRQSNLPIQAIIHSGEIKAQRNGNIYSISRMSDGERTALIIIAEVISAKTGSIFIIDEPELHLHRSIVVPLIAALVVERPDCTMLVSTHELELPSVHPECKIMLVRGCTWNDKTPSNWDIDIIEGADSIPDNLRVDLLGSRKKILFVEGTSASLDQPLYALLYPNASVRHRDTCTEVRRAVIGLRQVQSYHHAQAFGLVDNDGMNADFKQKLSDEGVYALPLFSVESIYYAPELLNALARKQQKILGTDAQQLLDHARERALATLRQAGKAEHLAARISERSLRDNLLAQLPTRGDLVTGRNNSISISMDSPYPEALKKVGKLIADGDLNAVIAGYPVRETGVLGDLAKSLRFQTIADYERAALTAINGDAKLKTAIKKKLGILSQQLE